MELTEAMRFHPREEVAGLHILMMVPQSHLAHLAVLGPQQHPQRLGIASPRGHQRVGGLVFGLALPTMPSRVLPSFIDDPSEQLHRGLQDRLAVLLRGHVDHASTPSSGVATLLRSAPGSRGTLLHVLLVLRPLVRAELAIELLTVASGYLEVPFPLLAGEVVDVAVRRGVVV